jgi:peptidoglycan/LPS O-acetylase OafA/YrhL
MHNKNLDGLRGWAAFAVVIFHSILHYDMASWQRLAISPFSTFSTRSDWLTGLALIIFNGETAVVVFFVMSGLVLHASLIRSKADPFRISTAFVVKRVFRVYPAVVAAVLVTVILSKLTAQQFSHSAILENITLEGNAVLGVSWTLTVEMIAMVVILPVFFAVRAFGPVALLVAAAYAIVATDNPALVFDIQNFHVAMIAFIAGMALAMPQAGAFFSSFGRWTWITLLAVLVFTNHINSAWATSSVLLRVGAATLLVGSLRYARNAGLDEFLSNRVSQYLGKISFSFYLFNVPVMYAVFDIVPTVAPKFAAVAGIPTGLLIAAITVPIAALSYRFVERPFMRLASVALGQFETTFAAHTLIERDAPVSGRKS